MSGKYQIIFAIWLLQLVNYIERVVMGFAAPTMMKSLGIDTTQMGVVMSSFAVGYLLTQIPGGLIADKWGARVVLVVGPLFWALFTGLTGLAVTVTTLVVVRLFFGIAEGLSNVASYKVVGDNFDPTARARAVSIWVTAFAAAPVLAGPAVGYLLSSFSWHVVFFLLAIPALVAAAVNYICLPVSPAYQSIGSEEDGHNVWPLLREPSLWLIGLAFCLWSIAYWGVLGWMPTYLSMERHIDVKGAGLMSAVPYLFGFVGLFFSGWLGGGPMSRQRPYLLAMFYIGGCLSLYFAYVADTLASSLVGLSGAAFFIYGALGTYGAVVLDFAPPRSRAAFSGMTGTIGQIGSVLAPIVIGYLVTETGSFASGFFFMGGALFIAGLAALALVPLAGAKRAALLRKATSS